MRFILKPLQCIFTCEDFKFSRENSVGIYFIGVYIINIYIYIYIYIYIFVFFFFFFFFFLLQINHTEVMDIYVFLELYDEVFQMWALSRMKS